MATLTAYVFGKKHKVDNRSSALTTKRGLLHHELWSTNGLKLDRHFTHPPEILHSTSLPGLADGGLLCPRPQNILSLQWHRVGRPSVAIHR